MPLCLIFLYFPHAHSPVTDLEVDRELLDERRVHGGAGRAAGRLQVLGQPLATDQERPGERVRPEVRGCGAVLNAAQGEVDAVGVVVEQVVRIEPGEYVVGLQGIESTIHHEERPHLTVKKKDALERAPHREGRPVESIPLELGGPHWRTHSHKTLWGIGRWSVEVRDSEDRVLATATFDCVPAGSN